MKKTYKYQLLYISLIVTIMKNPVINIQEIKRKKYKHTEPRKVGCSCYLAPQEPIGRDRGGIFRSGLLRCPLSSDVI